MHLICACLLCVVVLSSPVLAQQASSVQQRAITYDLWLARSKTITEDLIKDADDMTPSDRAMLWARLAQRWWRDDPEQAHSWILKSVEAVETVPLTESPVERSQRLAAARWLLGIVAPVDKQLSKRLIDLLVEDAQHMGDIDRSANAEGLVEAALTLAEKDPQRAAELGALALRVGRPPQITSLIFSLRPKDVGLADALFVQTLEATRRAMDDQLMNSLTQISFPEIMQTGTKFPAPPDKLRIELLRLEIDYLQANPINAENHDSICTSVISFIAPVITQFDRLLPEQAPIARQSVSQCMSTEPLARQRVDDALRYQPLNTVDELLSAADDAKDMKTRTVYMYRAAVLAKQHDDLDRALKILDSMSTESRDFMGGSWEAYRWQWAALSAIRHFKNGDLYGMRQVINAVPDSLQPFAKLAFVGQLPAARNKETDPTLEFLNDVRVGLRRSTISDAEKYGWCFGLLKLTVKYQPAEAITDLKEAVATLNRAEQAKGKNGDKDQAHSFDTSSISKTLPSELIEMDEYTLREAIASITSPYTRAQVRLELLRACLQRLGTTKRASPNMRASTSKGE